MNPHINDVHKRVPSTAITDKPGLPKDNPCQALIVAGTFVSVSAFWPALSGHVFPLSSLEASAYGLWRSSAEARILNSVPAHFVWRLAQRRGHLRCASSHVTPRAPGWLVSRLKNSRLKNGK